MEEAVRVRLVFEDRRLLSKPLRSQGLKRSWLLLRPGLLTVSDVTTHIVDSFGLHSSCPDGLLLSMDDFVLPPFESIGIFKEKDVIWVKKKGRKLREVIGNMANANLIEDAHIEEKQPLLLCDKLLANEEFKKESGGYMNEEECDDGDKPEEPSHLKSAVPKTKSASPKRKRKLSNDLHSSKRKKNKISSPEKLAISPTGDSEVVRRKQIESFLQKETRCQQNILKKSVGSSIADGRTTPSSDDNETSEDKAASASVEDRQDLVQEHEGNGKTPTEDGGSKKLPSRSARRKKAKRLWLRNQANSEKKDAVQNLLPESDGRKKSPERQTVVQNTDGEAEIVPIVVRPGHIRFEPLDHEPTRQHRPDQVTLQWNGTTSKKKGQKWGREKNFTVRIDNKSNLNEQSDKKHNAEAVVPGSIESKKLIPLTRSPKEGEVVVYQLLELSSSWCPEISPVRVGKVKSFDPNTMNAVLVPVPGHPIAASADKTDEECTEQPIPSLYKEDGTLEIDFSSLIDVRVFVDGKISDTTVSNGNKESANGRDLTAKPGTCSNGRLDHVMEEAAAPTSEKNESGGWEEVDRALSEKKAELLQKDGWSNWSTANEHSSNTSWTFRVLRRSAIGPTMTLLRASKGL